MKMKTLVALAFTVFVCMSFIAVPVMSFQPQPDPPGDIIRALEKLDDLKDLINTYVDRYPTLFTDTNTMQQANALYHKIDVVVGNGYARFQLHSCNSDVKQGYSPKTQLL